MVISLEIMAMFRKAEGESRGSGLRSFSDLDCSLSGWTGTVPGSSSAWFRRCSFPCHHSWYARRPWFPRSAVSLVCLICWGHHSTGHVHWGAWEEQGTTLLCMFPFLSPFLKSLNLGCVTGSCFYLCFFVFFLDKDHCFWGFLVYIWYFFQGALPQLLGWVPIRVTSSGEILFIILFIVNKKLMFILRCSFPNVCHWQTSFMEFCPTHISSVLLFIQYFL